jgi:epoxyqueuosine reductase QueG
VIITEICRYVAESPANRFEGSDDTFFEKPLIGIVAYDDPLWMTFKRVIGDYHLTPDEMIASSLEGKAWSPRSVISWVLPISEKTRMINKREKQWPSKEWVLTANQGNLFLAQLRDHVVAFLTSQGRQAAVPQPITIRERVGALDVTIGSSWSERHVAFAAGLGSFSLNAGLITSRGIAHRCGSVITDLELHPTHRPFSDYRHYCLFHREGTCGACIKRCPSGALSPEGNDKAKCYAHIYGKTPTVLTELYGLTPDDYKIGSCGLCQTKVPCESGIPVGGSQ